MRRRWEETNEGRKEKETEQKRVKYRKQDEKDGEGENTNDSTKMKFKSVKRGREGWRDEMWTEGRIEEGLRLKKDEAKIARRGSERRKDGERCNQMKTTRGVKR